LFTNTQKDGHKSLRVGPVHWIDENKVSASVRNQRCRVWLCSYVSAMVPVKTMKEYDLMQDLTVLFCETVDRCVVSSLLRHLNLQIG